MFSIDQNCHSLWDVLPKLQALASRGYHVRHFVEDLDVAFTSLGSDINTARLRLVRERFHHSGGADWGAALFYSEFLGRGPVEIRDWEELTGLKTNVLARRLGRSVDDLYDEFSSGDTWQLIGPSYVGDRRHHRLIGDLTVAETADFLRIIMQKAKENMLRTFPQESSRKRLGEWFHRELQRLEGLLDRCAGGRLTDVYGNWLGQYLGESVRIDLSSSLFTCGDKPVGIELLEVFLQKYDLAAELYNQAVMEVRSGLRPLRTAEGELPFFAVLNYQGHFVRTAVFLDNDEIQIGEQTFKLAADRRAPIEALRLAGVRCLLGKAILLVIQVRLGPRGKPLALPYRGSLYMPAANRLAAKLAAHRLLPDELKPIVRVRFRLLDRLKSLETPISLPKHLVGYFGKTEIPARELSENYRSLAAEASGRLDAFKKPAGRRLWQRANCPKLLETIEQLDKRRRKLARLDKPAPSPRGGGPRPPEQIRDLWKQLKAAQRELLDKTLQQIAGDWQACRIDYWDSRGALLPWSIGLGGRGFYHDLIDKAEIYKEPSGLEVNTATLFR